MESILHIVTKSEINYGILSIRVSDGTKKLLDGLPERFTVDSRGTKIQNRKITTKKVWLGYSEMK